jgi:hypothetical protein
VVDECNEGGLILVPDLAGLPWVKVMAVESEMHLPALFELDHGERDTLLLGLAHTDALVLMDEKLGRNMAEAPGPKGNWYAWSFGQGACKWADSVFFGCCTCHARPRHFLQ